MGLFGSKKSDTQAAPFGSPPVERAMALQQQGFDPQQSVEALQRDGYNTAQSIDALNQATPQVGPEPYPQTMQEAPPAYQQQGNQYGYADVEQVAESVAQEKFDSLNKDVQKLKEDVAVMGAKLEQFSQMTTDLKDDVKNLHQALIGKIGDYDKTLLDVGTDIKAMEKVFTKMLPELTSNIQELDRITSRVKGK
ncbi:hypothetical protein HY483_03925 [Candidatus Woesearchaeota archaeon]|nr:hypothetical protein [Candidatus Woesearchaeota archaeon]